jgi:hypothetical protein
MLRQDDRYREIGKMRGKLKGFEDVDGEGGDGEEED